MLFKCKCHSFLHFPSCPTDLSSSLSLPAPSQTPHTYTHTSNNLTSSTFKLPHITTMSAHDLALYSFPLSVLLLIILCYWLSRCVTWLGTLRFPFNCLSASVCHVHSPSFPSLTLTRCPVCIYSTNRPAAMECHLKTHCKMEYRCRICQGLWPDQASLEAHMRGHRLGNHYKCEQCGYLSKTANKLIEHVRVHTGERPFHCDRCSYSCKRKDNLNLHKKLKHAPRQTFGCQECPFTTTHPFVFSRHLKKHQSGGMGGLDVDVEGRKEKEDEEARREELPLEGTSPQHSSLLRGKESYLFSREGSSKGSGSNSPLMSLTASQALQSVALSLTLGKSYQPDPTSPLHGTGSTNGSNAIKGRSVFSSASPSIFPPSSRHMLEQYRNCDQAHLIPLTTLLTHNSRFTFHSHLHSSWRPATSPLVFSPNLEFPSSASHKHSFLAYLGLIERAKTV